MPQNADNVLDHFNLFRQPEYKEMFENKKKNFENPVPDAELERVREWTKTDEYREKNFAREALTVNPAKACQPLGAVFAAVGFESTIPFVHGSQGCVAYTVRTSRVTSRKPTQPCEPCTKEWCFQSRPPRTRRERLASLGGIDRQGFTGEILFTIFVRLGPFTNALKLGVRNGIFEILLLVLEHFLVFRLPEQVEMVEDVVCVLWHLSSPCRRRAASLSQWRARVLLAGDQAAQGALAIFQTGELIAMSMSRAKIAKPS